jgi:hypothetical protein
VLHGVLLALLVNVLHAYPSDTISSWRSVAIYQLLTDRFAGSNLPCDDLSKYCGGTFSGAQSMAPYVHAMGFNAIWISPIPENSPSTHAAVRHTCVCATCPHHLLPISQLAPHNTRLEIPSTRFERTCTVSHLSMRRRTTSYCLTSVPRCACRRIPRLLGH